MYRFAGRVALVLALAASARADSFVVFEDDRLGFEQSLRLNQPSSVVDSDGLFAVDPLAAGGLDSVLRSGSIDGQPFAYRVYDIDFSNTPTGTLTPGVAGGDIADLDRLNVELPASQSGAKGSGSWGLDSLGGSTASANALLIDFVTTTGGLGVGHFGLDLIDWEASAAFTSGQLRLYDDGNLVFTYDFAWGPGAGNGEVHFLGVAAVGASFFDQALVVLGDDGPGGGNFERWAADRIMFGQAVATPEPASFALLALGLLGLAVVVRRRRVSASSGPG